MSCSPKDPKIAAEVSFAMRSNKELRALAMDFVDGKAFPSWACRSPDDVGSSFMILSFMKLEDRLDLRRRDVIHLFEYLDKASPMGCNGMPIFFSARILNRAECQKLFPMMDALVAQRKQWVEDSDSSS